MAILQDIVHETTILFIQRRLCFAFYLVVPLAVPRRHRVRAEFAASVRVMDTKNDRLVVNTAVYAGQISYDSQAVAMGVMLDFASVLLHEGATFHVTKFLISGQFSVVTVVANGQGKAVLRNRNVSRYLVSARATIAKDSAQDDVFFGLARVAIKASRRDFEVLVTTRRGRVVAERREVGATVNVVFACRVVANDVYYFSRLPIDVDNAFPFYEVMDLTRPRFAVVVFRAYVPFIPVCRQAYDGRRRANAGHRARSKDNATVGLYEFVRMEDQGFLKGIGRLYVGPVCRFVRERLSARRVQVVRVYRSVRGEGASVDFGRLPVVVNGRGAAFVLRPFSIDLARPLVQRDIDVFGRGVDQAGAGQIHAPGNDVPNQADGPLSSSRIR